LFFSLTLSYDYYDTERKCESVERNRNRNRKISSLMDALNERDRELVFNLVMPYVLEPHIEIITNQKIIDVLLTKTRTHIPQDYADRVTEALYMFETHSSSLRGKDFDRLINTLEIDPTKLLPMYVLGVNSIKERLCMLFQNCVLSLDESRHISRLIKIVSSTSYDETLRDDIADVVLQFYSTRHSRAYNSCVCSRSNSNSSSNSDAAAGKKYNNNKDQKPSACIQNIGMMIDIIKAEAYPIPCEDYSLNIDYMGVKTPHVDETSSVHSDLQTRETLPKRRNMDSTDMHRKAPFVDKMGCSLLSISTCLPQRLIDDLVATAVDVRANRAVRKYLFDSIIADPRLTERLSNESIDKLCNVITEGRMQDASMQEAVTNVLSSSGILYKLKERQVQAVGECLREMISRSPNRSRKKRKV